MEARHFDALMRLAALQAKAWARAGLDVESKIIQHARDWPRECRSSLVFAALEAWEEVRDGIAR